MVKAAAAAVDVPIFCKIRLLNSLADTVELVRQLRDAGASLIAIHGRKRATWERKGAGARDGPALLDQVAAVKQQVPNVAIVTNGNTKTWQDVEDNLESTETEGLMSAEGLLDNPALFLGRYGSREEPSKHVAVPDALASSSNEDKQKNKLQKLLRKIQRIELKVASKGQSAMSIEDKERLSTKVSVQASLAKLDAPIADEKGALPAPGGQVSLSLGSLYESSDDKVQLTLEYLDLATKFPVVIRSVIFHTRRILKDALDQYQLMEECLACQTLQQVREIVLQIRGYQADPASFVYDREKAKQEKEALERKRREEGKRKEYEARMMRKAKREGKSDLMVRSIMSSIR
jgi:tRNA-dihydrouridine synthase 1